MSERLFFNKVNECIKMVEQGAKKVSIDNVTCYIVPSNNENKYTIRVDIQRERGK